MNVYRLGRLFGDIAERVNVFFSDVDFESFDFPRIRFDIVSLSDFTELAEAITFELQRTASHTGGIVKIMETQDLVDFLINTGNKKGAVYLIKQYNEKMSKQVRLALFWMGYALNIGFIDWEKVNKDVYIAKAYIKTMVGALNELAGWLKEQEGGATKKENKVHFTLQKEETELGRIFEGLKEARVLSAEAGLIHWLYICTGEPQEGESNKKMQLNLSDADAARFIEMFFGAKWKTAAACFVGKDGKEFKPKQLETGAHRITNNGYLSQDFERIKTIIHK